MSNPATSNNLPPSISGLTIKEIFLFTRIPLYLLEGFIKGTFKPNRRDREKLSELSRRFFRWNENEIRAFLNRKKYRAIKSFLSLTEKDELLSQQPGDKYGRKLDEFIEKYWDQIILAEK